MSFVAIFLSPCLIATFKAREGTGDTKGRGVNGGKGDTVLMNIVISAVQCAVNISKSNFHPPTTTTTTTRDFSQAQQVSTSALLIRHVKLVSLCQQLLLQFQLLLLPLPPQLCLLFAVVASSRHNSTQIWPKVKRSSSPVT